MLYNTCRADCISVYFVVSCILKNVVYCFINGDVGIYLLRSLDVFCIDSNMSCGPPVVHIKRGTVESY